MEKLIIIAYDIITHPIKLLVVGMILLSIAIALFA